MFVEGKSAMFHGHPTVMQQLQKQMDAELIRIPYFSQTSDESYVYMTPSLNIAFNKNLEKDREKLDTALDVLDCMISEEGQKLIADGSGVISLNTDVPTMMQDVPGLEEEINHNAVYIRYSAQKSFDASLEAVHGLLSGEMDETQAYDTLRSVMNRKDPEEKATVNFENEYSISLNDRNGRDAASSILTTIREENDAQLALAPYYYFTSSMYKGECTSSRVGMMTAKSSDTPLYVAKINGKQVYELVENYLADADENFYVTNKYELPIASGMKMIVNQEESGFSLKDLTVNGCGRTDAGVHALRYCANFRSDCTIPIEKVPLALNARLPGDIAVTDACEVDESFNAIGSCIQKEYIYKILNSRIPDPFLDKRVCFYPSRLDIAQMRAAAKAFEGTHDFAAVRSVGTETKTTVRTVYWCDAEREGDLITVRVCANGFLYNIFARCF